MYTLFLSSSTAGEKAEFGRDTSYLLLLQDIFIEGMPRLDLN